MRRFTFAVAAIALCASPAAAQDVWPRFEVGATWADGRLSRDEEGVTARGSLNGPSLFFAFHPTSKLMLELSELRLVVASGSGLEHVSFSTNALYLFRGASRLSPYVSLGVAGTVGNALSVDGAGEFGMGVGAGVRLPLSDAFSGRLGAAYRRWPHDRVNQWGVSLSLGYGFGVRR